jgi:crossover junction endodeoxyribonuclease RuvC
MSIILGVDPGAHGALAVLTESGELLAVPDMPSTPEANGRVVTNAPLFAGILARVRASAAFCESVGARPTDARVAAFAFGRVRGVIEGCAGALGLPIVFLTPPTWNGWPRFRPARRTRTCTDPRNRPVACSSGSFRPQVRRRSRRSLASIALAGLRRETHHV